MAKRECPYCHSEKIVKDGNRTTDFGKKQRFSCKECSYKFSTSKVLKRDQLIDNNRQLCAEAKNLAVECTGLLVVPQKRDIQTLEIAVVEFMLYLQKLGRKKDTYEPYCFSLEFLIKNGADLFDPESVKALLVKLGKTEARNYNLIKAYKAFLNAYGIKTNLPKYVPDRKLPYLPPEAHLDSVIASCNTDMAALCQTLKETAA